jgi:uncharacterized protein
MNPTENTRREFLQTTVAGAAALGAASVLDAQEDATSGKGLPTRPLGKTGVRVSILGLGGHSIGTIKEEKEAIKVIHAAIDEGITFMDNAWDYHEGRSEEIYGKALATDGKRAKVFLMTKNCGRDAKDTRKCLEDSLKRLQTDHVDLWMFHEINYDNDPDWVVEKGGLAEALKAQKEGKVRFLGFTGHKSPHIHLHMLEKHAWDAVLMPVNVCDPHYRSFIREVLPKANAAGIGPLGMKSMGGGQGEQGRFVMKKVCTAEEARRFSLSQPITTLVVGIDSMTILKQDVGIARSFQPMSAAEQEKLLARVKPHATDGRHERFKSTQFFDSDYHKKQHGLTEAEVKG